MKSNRQIIAIIPARAGSKGIPMKNMAPLAGRPLIHYTILAAIQSRYVKRVIVSTDSQDIADAAEKLGAEVPFLRPDDLSGDRTPLADVLAHAVVFLEKSEKARLDSIVTLLPTNPFRSALHVDEALDLFIRKKADALNSMHPVHERSGDLCWFHHAPASPGTAPSCFATKESARGQKLYVANGAVTILSRQRLRILQRGHFSNLEGRRVVAYIMDEIAGFDINDREDLLVAEHLLSSLKRKEPEGASPLKTESERDPQRIGAGERIAGHRKTFLAAG